MKINNINKYRKIKMKNKGTIKEKEAKLFLNKIYGKNALCEMRENYEIK